MDQPIPDTLQNLASSAAQAGLAGCRIECASGFEADSKTEGWAKDEWKADASWKDSSWTGEFGRRLEVTRTTSRPQRCKRRMDVGERVILAQGTSRSCILAFMTSCIWQRRSSACECLATSRGGGWRHAARLLRRWQNRR